MGEENEIQEGAGSAENQGQEVDTSAAQTSAEGQQEGQPEAKKPAERPKHWGGRSEAVPYDRFQEVNTRRDAAEREAAALRQRVEELERSRTPQANPDDPETIDASKFTDASGNFDSAAYMRERDRRIAATAEKRALEKVEARLSERDSQRQVAESVERANTAFRGQVAEASKANPQVAEAVEYLDAIAQHIPFPVQMAILRSAPEVAHAIAVDPELVAQITRGNPADSIMVIGEINGRIKASKAPAAPAANLDEIPAFRPGQQAPARTAPIPRTLSGGGGGRNPSNMPLADYFKARDRGEI